jgi:hypothetical protein
MINKLTASLALTACALLAFHPTHVNADVISTGFAGGNGQSGNMFDVNILAVMGIEISQFDLNLDPGNWDIELYTKPGAYGGSETTPGDWTLLESITGLTSAGENVATAWDVSDFTIGSGAHAFYVNVTSGPGLNYTNGSAEGSLLASNADIEIFEGIGNQANFGNQFRPRNWNGNIVYEPVTTAIPEPNSVVTLAGICLVFSGLRRRRV